MKKDDNKLYSKIVKISLLFCVIVTFTLSIYIFYFDSNEAQKLNQISQDFNNSKLLMQDSAKYCKTKEDYSTIFTNYKYCRYDLSNKIKTQI